MQLVIGQCTNGHISLRDFLKFNGLSPVSTLKLEAIELVKIEKAKRILGAEATNAVNQAVRTCQPTACCHHCFWTDRALSLKLRPFSGKRQCAVT